MPRELMLVHSKRYCKSLLKIHSVSIWVEFRDGCCYHFRGEEHKDKEVCRHKAGSLITPKITTFNAAATFLELMRKNSDNKLAGEAYVYDKAGHQLGWIKTWLNDEGQRIIDIQPFCKCLNEYNRIPVVAIQERNNEQGAAVRSLLRILDGELPVRPVRMPQEI